jgi:hypothetical protein
VPAHRARAATTRITTRRQTHGRHSDPGRFHLPSNLAFELADITFPEAGLNGSKNAMASWFDKIAA